MSFEGFCRTLGKIISEFARFILFFKSILFLVISLILLAFLYQSKKNIDYVQLTGMDSGLLALEILGIYLVCLAIYGVCASFFASKDSIKWFAVLASLNVIMGVAILMYTSPKLEGVQSDVVKKLKGFQPNYDWDHSKDASPQVKNATQAWDSIQADQECCGLDSADDWISFRPEGHKDDAIYPSSCCKNSNDPKEKYCRQGQGVWTTGCSESVSGINRGILIIVTFMICFSMTIALLAGVVILCRPRSQYEGY